MTRVIYIGLIALVVIMATFYIFAGHNMRLTPLGKVHQNIVTEFPNMTHISRAEIETRLTSGEILLLDTRPVKEYNVSHIAGALQVDPDISPELFLIKFREALKNKQVVVYCSVGQRSSVLGTRLYSTALSAGAMSVQNMEGGLFGWHNDKRPLVNASGSTSKIHPYNTYWGALIENKDAIRYSP